jgi:hypothetical protein
MIDDAWLMGSWAGGLVTISNCIRIRRPIGNHAYVLVQPGHDISTWGIHKPSMPPMVRDICPITIMGAKGDVYMCVFETLRILRARVYTWYRVYRMCSLSVVSFERIGLHCVITLRPLPSQRVRPDGLKNSASRSQPASLVLGDRLTGREGCDRWVAQISQSRVAWKVREFPSMLRHTTLMSTPRLGRFVIGYLGFC